MRKTQTLGTVRHVVVLGCVLTSACSGGGGGAAISTTASAAATSAPPAAPTFCGSCLGPSSLGANSDTGIATGPIAAPLAASFGSPPTQIAAPGGPTFDGSSGGYPANVTFPLISTSLKSASPGLSATATPDATLTVISTSANSTNFQLVIPSLNLNANFTNRENIVTNLDGVLGGYSYVAAGSWDVRTNPLTGAGPLLSSTALSFGYETSSSAMPTTGTANFSGYASASVFKPVNGTIAEAGINGNANLSANFSSGQVTGALTKMQQFDGFGYTTSPGYLSWNDVSLNASITPGTNRFSGSTAATSAPGTGFSLAGSASGHIDGAFYGPAAQNLGAVWSLTDGTSSALGTIVAH